MVDFGDEFIIDSYKIPWLIWIQLLITLLLVALLFFGLALFTSDASTSSSAAASAGGDAAPSPYLNHSTSSNGIITEVECPTAGGDAGTNGELNGEEDEDSSLMDNTAFLSILRHPSHPCNYFGLAKDALFKCFGLDSSSESSSRRKHEKRD